jgi:acetoin utilization deacetylase AcuC-like enzyme
MKVTLYSHSAFDFHATPAGHPEQVARLHAVKEALAEFDLNRCKAPIADEAEVLRCHPQAYLDLLRAALPTQGLAQLDGDTYLAPGSLEAGLRAVGAAVAAVDAVLSGATTRAFIAARPPGHHAETNQAMGFCLFGTVAIAAKRALDHHGLSRVVIVDFDVHHGNGTQDLLWDEERVLFCSSQQIPLYPSSGEKHERGAHNQSINQPLPPGSDGATMREAYLANILPQIDAFAPELILISAGFDAHRADPLANLMWHEGDFVWLTAQICDLAERHCQGRVVSSLEGGYNLEALAASVAAHVTVLQEHGP